MFQCHRDIPGQHILDFIEGLEMVVEHDDAARARVFPALAEAPLTADLRVVIAAEQRPHDDVIAVSQCPPLRRGDLAVGRAEQTAVDKLPALVRIFHIGCGICLPAFEVVVAVVAGCMPCQKYLPVCLGIFLNIGPHAEKSGTDISFLKQFKYARGCPGRRSVIKSEVYGLVAGRHFPPESGPAQQPEPV